MSEELKPCLCGQKQDEHQMLVVERCDFDGYYIKCDSCGACGPVGYPGVEYDACDYDACDKANEEAEAKAISLWDELWEGRERLRAEIERIKAMRDALINCLPGFCGVCPVPNTEEYLNCPRTQEDCPAIIAAWAAREAAKSGDAS